MADALGERFDVKEELGRGGMGAVYRVYDRLRRTEAALKILRGVDPARLYQFKREFRALSDVAHNNLVTLYELTNAGDLWYFTMELIDGCDFLEFVRPYQHLVEEENMSLETATGANDTAETQAASTSKGGVSGARRLALVKARLKPRRLRAAFVQLAEGVRALHEAGKMHRDLKPSNVMVEQDGRVVVCDFGLVAELGGAGSESSRHWGTPAYMAPEQAAGAELTAATDWYSAGVMLYEALTGSLPFEGPAKEVMRAKQVGDPLAPRDRVPGVDPALSELCMAMLSRTPSTRPGSDDVLAALGGTEGERRSPAAPSRVSATRTFVGRTEELEVLRSYVGRRGSGSAVFVSAPSGMGKTALCRRFLEEVELSGAMVLAGRCYQREVVPYKALDALVDALGAELVAMAPEDRAELLPRDISAVVRLFPSLARATGEEEQLELGTGDAQDLRQRAFVALAELLRRIASRRPVVLFIDDLQWGDLDSVPFLASLVHDADQRPLMLLANYRAEDRADSPPLCALLDPGSPSSVADVVEVIQLGPLGEDEATELTAELAGESGEFLALVREAEGHPLLLTEIVRAGGDLEASFSGIPALETLLAQRVAQLGEAPRALLTAAAVAGRPMPVSLMCEAAEIRDEPAAMAVLTAQQLVRTHSRPDGDEIECVHDRIRETAVAMLSDREHRYYHRRIARSLEWTHATDPMALVEHWMAAGDRERAGRYAAEAAARAERALAFDQAARYYELQLELTRPVDDERESLLVRLGDILAHAGRPDGAARRYIEAADDADPGQAVTLRCRAAEELIRFGQTDEGIDLAKSALKQVGLRFPDSKARVIAGILSRRMWMKLRGIKVRSRDEADPVVLRRIDACQAVAGGLSFVLPIYGAYFQTRQLWWALSAGDPYRATMALNLDIGFRSLAGSKSRALVRELVATARSMAEDLGSLGLQGFAVGGNGVSAFLSGEFAEAYRDCNEGARLLRKDFRPGLKWQGPIVEIYGYSAALFLGKYREMCDTVPRRVRQTLERRNAYAARALRAWRTNVVWLLLDQPEEALRQADEGAPDEGSGAFTIQHYYRLVTLGRIRLYRGQCEQAHAELEDGWRALGKTMHLRIQSVRIEGGYMRARCAVAAASATTGDARAAALKIAQRCARALAGENVLWATALSELVTGTVAALRDQPERAEHHLRAAVAGLDDADMAPFAAAARDRLGRLIGGDEGDALRAEARAWFDGQALPAPERVADMLAPGWPAD